MRLWPRSLLGQMFLGVAAALLVAQSISAGLQYRAQTARMHDRIATTVAVRLTSGRLDERISERRSERRRARGPRARLRIVRTIDPASSLAPRQHAMERAIRSTLDAQGLGTRQIRAQIVSTLGDPVAQRLVRQRPRMAARRPLPDRLVLVSVQLTGESDWLQLRVPLPENAGPAIAAILLQTVLLYLLLIGGLWLLLRRIVGPLRSLTTRVEDFAMTQSAGDPMKPSGPEETRRLIRAHNAMEARIVAMLDEKDVMLGAIGHDLKTPLAALRVRIESVPDDAARAKMAASIEDLTRSLDDILSLARVGRPSDPAERVELSALAAGLVEEFEDMGDPVTLVASERMAAMVRVTWLRRALRNLITNALRYGGTAQLSLAREGNDAVFAVCDNGPGIPTDQIEAMMEPFQRGEASRNRTTGGAGLGLTLARAIAQQHGGTLTLSNRAPNGLRAELRLPFESRRVDGSSVRQ